MDDKMWSEPWLGFKIVFIYFYVFAIVGRYLEVIWAPIRATILGTKKFEPKTLTQMPMALSYGFGAVGMVVIIAPVMQNLDWLGTFMVSALLAAATEYISGTVIEKIYGGKNPYWDYSKEPFNLKGRICLETTVLFGIAGALFLKFLLPVLDQFLQWLGSDRITGTFWILFILFIVDLVYSIIENFYLKRGLVEDSAVPFRNAPQLAGEIGGEVRAGAGRLLEAAEKAGAELVAGEKKKTTPVMRLLVRIGRWQSGVRVRARKRWGELEARVGRQKRDYWLEVAKLFIYFFVFSILGHYLEIVWAPIYGLITGGASFVPKMFLQLPLAPPYGLGVVAIIMIVKPFKERFKLNIWGMFIMNVIVCTLVGYVIASGLELVFGQNIFWDFSGQLFNFEGKVGLQSSLLFGLVATGFLLKVEPWTRKVFKKFSRGQILGASGVLVVMTVADLIFSVMR